MDSCEFGNETSGSIKGKKFLDVLSDHQLFKKDSASWRVSYYVVFPFLFLSSQLVSFHEVL